VTLPNTPAALARYAKAQTTAINWLSKALKSNQLGSVLKVSSTPITKDLIPRLRALGGGK
jgi:hypothetical protein